MNRLVPLSLLAMAAALSAPSARAETLEDAIAYVYETDPGLLAQRAALRALDEGYVQARAGYGPQASITVSLATQEFEQRGANFEASNPSQSLAVSQPLYTGGRVLARVNQAQAQILQGRNNLRRYEAELLQRVITVYVNVRRDMEVLRISADAVKVLDQQLSDTLAKFKVRQVTATDVAQSRARLASARTQLAFAEGQLAVSRAQYLSIVGRNPGELAPEPPLPEPPRQADRAFDLAEGNSPVLAAADFAEQVSRARVAEARAGRLPSVSLRLDARRDPIAPYAKRGYSESLTTSITLTQPLFSSGVISSQVRQAVEENNRDRLNVEATRRTVIQSVAEAWEALAAARRALVSQQDEVREAQTAFYGVREEERFALRTTIDILNAEAELRNAQLELVRGRANEYLRRAQLLAAMGVLSAEHLVEDLKPYDPARNTRRVWRLSGGPWDLPLRALESIAGVPEPRRRPATFEDQTPNRASDLPPPPDPRSAPPILATSELMKRLAQPSQKAAEPPASR